MALQILCSPHRLPDAQGSGGLAPARRRFPHGFIERLEGFPAKGGGFTCPPFSPEPCTERLHPRGIQLVRAAQAGLHLFRGQHRTRQSSLPGLVQFPLEGRAQEIRLRAEGAPQKSHQGQSGPHKGREAGGPGFHTREHPAHPGHLRHSGQHALQAHNSLDGRPRFRTAPSLCPGHQLQLSLLRLQIPEGRRQRLLAGSGRFASAEL